MVLNSICKIIHIKAVSLFFPAIVSFLLLSSCNEQPTFMGSGLLQDTVTLYSLSTSTDTLITGGSSFIHHLNTINNGAIHIGIANDIKATSLIRFDEPVKMDPNKYNFFVNYSVDKITSCKIKLYTNRYTFGDSLNPNALSFKIYNAINEWTNMTNGESLDVSNIIDFSNAVGTFNGSITQKDSMDVLEIDIDKNVFMDWVKKWDKYNKGDTTSIVWGLALVPDDNSTVIRQFAGISGDNSKASEMIIQYIDSTGNPDSLILQKAIDKSFYKLPVFDSQELIVQGAFSIRSMLNFDVSKIPPNSAIHAAKFEITLNREKSYNGNFPLDSTLVAALAPDSSLFNGETFLRYYSSEINGDKFTFNSITSSIETWNRTTGKGVIVFFPEGTRNEFWELDKLSFYGPYEPDSTKRPTLKIVYSRIVR